MRNNRIGIDSGSSNQINESISKNMWHMMPNDECYYYFLVINNYMGCNEINQNRLKNNIY